MRNFKEHLILEGSSIKEALARLDKLAKDAILFVVNENATLKGSLTDGDVRRGLLRNLTTEDTVERYIQPNPRFIEKGNYVIQDIIKYRENNFKILPVLNKSGQVVNVINFRFFQSYLPLDVVIMAGGRGSRLSPLTDVIPKPLLRVGDKPIIEHNIDRLRKFGVDDFWISVGYLGQQLENYFKDGNDRGVSINYIWDDKPLGTIGAISKIKHFEHEYILITNSDILTTLNYEDFFLDFLEKDADMAVASIPYTVDVPYAVMETENYYITSFKEKPTYTYYSNGGIYLVKRHILERIPPNSYYNTTDLMQSLIENGDKLISYPLRQYWLDIGKPEDFEKAQADIKHLQL